MHPFQIKFYNICTNKNPEIHISELPDFQEIGPSKFFFFGKAFFQKLCASENDAERYRQRMKGTNFQTHLLFEFSSRQSGFTMSFWIQDRFLDSRWVPGFTMGSWIHDGFLHSWWIHDGFSKDQHKNWKSSEASGSHLILAWCCVLCVSLKCSH